MAANQTINFKDPLWITTWLDAALEKEKEKYRNCPVIPDYNPEYQDAQAWGYVVVGYFLVEEAFKALLYVRGKQVPAKHSLSTLFKLDGGQNRSGDHIGSFDWRYFPIEEKRSQKMPVVSVDYLHEIVYGCIRIIDYVKNGHAEPCTCTHSWRMRWGREKKYRNWFLIRMNTDGWDYLGDRLEILWGPDYRGRYDFYLFQGKEIKDCFAQIPGDIDLPSTL